MNTLSIESRQLFNKLSNYITNNLEKNCVKSLVKPCLNIENNICSSIRFKNNPSFGLSIISGRFSGYEVAFVYFLSDYEFDIVYPKDLGYDGDGIKILNLEEFDKECNDINDFLKNHIHTIVKKEFGYNVSFKPIELPKPLSEEESLLNVLEKKYQSNKFRMIDNNSKILLIFNENPNLGIRFHFKPHFMFEIKLIRIESDGKIHPVNISSNKSRKKYSFKNSSISKDDLFIFIDTANEMFNINKVALSSIV